MRTHIRDGLQRWRAPAQWVAFTRRSCSSSSSSSSQRPRIGRLECGAVAAFRCPRDAGTRGGGDHAPCGESKLAGGDWRSWSCSASLHGTDGRRRGKVPGNLGFSPCLRQADAPFSILPLRETGKSVIASSIYALSSLHLKVKAESTEDSAFLELFHPSLRALGATCFIALHPCRCSWLRAPLAPCGLVARRPCGGR